MKIKYFFLNPIRFLISHLEKGYEKYKFIVEIIDRMSFKSFPILIEKLMKIPGRQKITVSLIGQHYSFRYYSEPSDELNMSCRNNLLNWEPSSRAIWSALSIKSSYIMDIGAYTGVYALIAASSNPNAKIYAIEPNENIVNQLVKNIQINDFNINVELHHHALWSENMSLKLYSYEDSSKTSLYTKETEAKSFKEIEAFTIDSLSEYKNVDLIKIDVENSELKVLEGARKLLKSNSPIILMEALTINELNAQRKFLKEFSYLDPIQVSESGSDKRNYIWTTSGNHKRVQESISEITLIMTQS